MDLSHDKLSAVPAIRDFPYVFTEVTGLPLQREIEFRIYLVENVKQAVSPLRHMALKKRRELNKHVNELLEMV